MTENEAWLFLAVGLLAYGLLKLAGQVDELTADVTDAREMSAKAMIIARKEARNE